MRLIDFAPVFCMTRFKKFSERRLSLLDAAMVVGIARDLASRRPAVNKRHAIKFQIVGDLRCAVERAIERRVETVHEDEGVVLERRRLGQALFDERQHLIFRQARNFLHREMLGRVFLLLVDLDLEIRNFDQPRPLDMGDLVAERHGYQSPAELQLVPALGAELETLGIGFYGPIRAVEDGHHVIRLGRISLGGCTCRSGRRRRRTRHRCRKARLRRRERRCGSTGAYCRRFCRGR